MNTLSLSTRIGVIVNASSSEASIAPLRVPPHSTLADVCIEPQALTALPAVASGAEPGELGLLLTEDGRGLAVAHTVCPGVRAAGRRRANARRSAGLPLKAGLRGVADLVNPRARGRLPHMLAQRLNVLGLDF